MVHTFYSSGTLAPTTPRLFASPDYQISRSLRFNIADSANLTRTLTTATVRNRWTWSGWVKRSVLDTGAFQTLFGSSDGAIGNDFFGFNQAVFRLGMFGGTYVLQSNVQYRDPAAWYHVVVAVDTTQSTDTDRAKVYINGVQITAWGTAGYPPQNYSCSINGAFAHQIGSILSSSYSGMMLTEVNFVDGQQLSPGSFGYTESSTGVWTPLQYTGSYGTNGFYLNFADNSNTTSTTLGKDLSGNSNNWTPNNFSVTAGVGNDSFVDSPTNYGTDTGAGGEVRGNYATLNPLATPQLLGQYTISNGNLAITSSDTANSYIPATIGLPTSDKYYFEYACTNPDGDQRRDCVGLAKTTATSWLGSTDSIGYDCFEGKVNNNGTLSIASYATWNNGDIISVAVDCSTGNIWFAKNGSWQAGNPSAGTGATITLSNISQYTFAVGTRASGLAGYTVKGSVNFGQRPFAYTAPSGFKALCSQNLPTSILPQTAFAVNTFTNSNSSRIIGTGIQSDLVWSKRRESSGEHLFHDAIRGAGKTLYGTTSAEVDNGAYYVQGFNSDSYSIGASDNALNGGTGATYVSWTWNAGGTTVTNTTGSISAQVRANPAAGFSVVTYTGNSAADQTVGHGLGVAPSFIIAKSRSSAATNWVTYHSALGINYVTIFTTSATINVTGYWGTAAPSSTIFRVKGGGYENNINAGTMVAYCWAEIAGYSRFGSYTGNGAADGPFVYTGFRPRWIMIKSTGTESWGIWDSVRNDYNFADDFLLAQSSNGEQNGPQGVDFLSNGFKVRGNYAINNSSGQAYIFVAYAESPFKYSRAR
jgi:hypothetical protein